MKRAKQVTTARRQQDGGAAFWDNRPAAAEPEKSWEQDVAGQPDERFVAYALSARFSKGDLVAHAKFGKGLVLDADAQRVEVLFESGKKKLGHCAAS